MVARLALLAYLLSIVFFAFRPFQLIPGLRGSKPGGALEDGEGSRKIRTALMATNRMSLEILLKTDSLRQGGSARIVSFSRDTKSRNFTLGQEGNGLCFRLRTTETDDNGVYPSLLVQKVFDSETNQHLVITYDGAIVRLYIDGKLHPKAIALNGSFDNWGRNHLLTMGDESPGGRAWKGKIEYFSIYDRALDTTEVAVLCNGEPLSGAVYAYHNGGKGEHGMHPMKYRNLFINSDSGSNPIDSIVNIVGFIPLAPLFFLVFPAGLRRRQVLAVFLLPGLLGLAMSGTIEYMQRGISGRVPCLIDLMNNTLGTLLGCLLLWIWYRRFCKGGSA